MEARLYELIRVYQGHRTTMFGSAPMEFRLHPLVNFAQSHPELFPEYFADDGRLARAVAQARAAGEIIPLVRGSRDVQLILRVDRDRST